MSKLYSPYTLRGLELSNRIVMSPMCQYSATNGMANDWHLVHLGTRAVGGAGLVFTEAASVTPDGMISPSDLGIWSDVHVEPLKRIITFVKAQGASVGIQLAHAGRKASCAAPWEGGKQISASNGGWQTVAPSPIPFYEGDVAPLELTVKEIKSVLQSFIDAAKRAVSAGFDIIEIHAAHGYLLNQFLSPLANKREDDYGGSFEKRTRLLIEVTNSIRSVIPEEMPLFVRISAEEWAIGGNTINDSVNIARLLEENGADLIDCSSGGVVGDQKIPVEINYQVSLAEKIKAESDIATGAVGLITEIQQAEDILQQNKADLIFVGREMLRNPYFALLGAEQLNASPHWPKQYERGKPRKK